MFSAQYGLELTLYTLRLQSSVCNGDDASVIVVHLLRTQNVLDPCRENQNSRFRQVSSYEPLLPCMQPYIEYIRWDDPFGPLILTSVLTLALITLFVIKVRLLSECRYSSSILFTIGVLYNFEQVKWNGQVSSFFQLVAGQVDIEQRLVIESELVIIMPLLNVLVLTKPFHYLLLFVTSFSFSSSDTMRILSFLSFIFNVFFK